MSRKRRGREDRPRGCTRKDLAPHSRTVGAGTTRLVLLSGRGEAAALLAERRLAESGADWAVVRCAFFAQNLSETFCAESVRAGELVLPGHALEPMVDLEDVADVVAIALTEEGHTGTVYECTGPRLLGFDEAVAEISRRTGRTISFREVTPADFAAGLADAGMPLPEAEGLAHLFADLLDGHNSSLADGVRRALGRAPRDFAEHVRRTAMTGVRDA